MAVQTRTQLQNKSATVQNETAPSANTAARVGGLFDDFADSTVLTLERGMASLFVDAATPYGISDAIPSPIDITMSAGASYGNVLGTSDSKITYTGSNAELRVSCQLSFTGVNNRRYSFWIAIDGQEIPQSLWEDTLQGTHAHTVSCEAFVNASNGTQFEIFALSNDPTSINIKTLTFAAYVL
jgi:hypothetical protein